MAVPAVGVPVHPLGGDHVKVKPEGGNIVFERVTVEEFKVPAVVPVQVVVAVRLLKSALVAPLKPTCCVREVVLWFVIGPYTILMV